MTYKAILFDCYGTLIDFPTQRFIAAIAEICRNQGISCEAERCWETWLEVGRTMNAVPYPEVSTEGTRKQPAYLISGPPPPFRPYREEWAEQFERTFAALGGKGDGARAYEDLRRLLSTAKAYPDVHPALAALNRRYVTAILSNADDDFIFPCLERNQLRFSQVITSEVARSYKPWPDIFWLGAERLGLALTDILYVGDSPIADVLGARSAGLAVAWLNRHEATLPERVPAPDYEITSLAALDTLLSAQNSG